MKRLPIFIAGIAVGALAVIGALYRDVLSRQPQPKVDSTLGDGNVWRPEVWFNGDWEWNDNSLDDTQPVKVEYPIGGELEGTRYLVGDDEVGAWELEQWAKESE
jgi:hypothetical protein